MTVRPARTLLLATRSEGKKRELLTLLAPLGLRVLTLEDAGIPHSDAEEAIESFDTFEENALAKALHFARVSGLRTVADDSGLEVYALGMRPGVRSKRWSGDRSLSGRELDAANNTRLLAELSGVEDRRARFVCAAAFADGERTIVRRGESEGRILEAPTGIHGFGYDPLFWSVDLGRAFGEASAAEKAGASHRGRALVALRDALRDVLR